MHLKSIQLTGFKNHSEFSGRFSDKLNLITGPNGTGKTNILDAIHFLCNTKSAFSSTDNTAIKHNQDFFRLEAHFEENNKNVKVECVCQQTEKKIFHVENKAPDKLSEYIGRFPVVLITPYDTDVIREGSELRRRFFDQIICQTNSEYLEKLMKYNRLIKQRNALLKQFAETNKVNKSLISVYDEQIIPLILYIGETRSIFNQRFLPHVIQSYHVLAGEKEEIIVKYESVCNPETLEKDFLANLHTDLIAQRTTLGVHTDDYQFELKNTSVKKFGSQGQQKTFILALKIAHFKYILETKAIKPLLLLDDVFDRLDENRVNNLARLIDEGQFGQVFITDATPKRLTERFGNRTDELAIFKTS